MDNLHDSNKSMTTQTEALKLALEALEYYDKPLKEYSAKTARDKDFKAIAAIKEALAQPEQEPVAWGNFKEDGTLVGLSQHPEDQANWTGRKPLYTTPPQPKEPEHKPVAWMSEHRFDELRKGFTVMTTLTKQRAFEDDVAIYTAPPQRKE